MISGPQPGFLVLCVRTGTPVAEVSAAAWDSEGSADEPAVLETMRRESGCSFWSWLKWACGLSGGMVW